MNDPEKLYLLGQCLPEMLHLGRTFELHCKKNKNQIYSIRLPKILSQIVDVLSANPNCSGGRIVLGRAACITDCLILDT